MTQLDLFTTAEQPRIPFADSRVEATNVVDFINRYYRGDRLQGIERDIPGYVATVIAYHERFCAEQGYTLISRHESVTGRAVAWPMIDVQNC